MGSGVLARWGDYHLMIWLRAYAASRTEQQGVGKLTKCKVWGNLLRGSGKCSEEERLKLGQAARPSAAGQGSVFPTS